MDPEQVVRDERGVMRCRDCGFGYNLTPDEIVANSAAGLTAVRAALGDVPERVRGVRPSPAVWSVNAYVVHLAEAAAIITERVRAIASQERPFLPYYDQDRSIAEGRADEQPAEESLRQLEEAVPIFLELTRSLTPDQWDRVGIHARAGEVSLREVAHDMPHELNHHALDIHRIGSAVES